MSGLEATFAIVGGVGFVLLFLSFVLGLEHEVEFSHELEVGHDIETHDVESHGLAHGDLHSPSWFSTKVVAASLVGFGVSGYVATSAGTLSLLAWIIAVVGFFGVGAGTFFLVLKPLARQQSNTLLSRESYRGIEGQITLAISEQGSGLVVFRDQNGARVTQEAFAAEGEAIAKGTTVYIVDATQQGVIVMPSSIPQLEE